MHGDRLASTELADPFVRLAFHAHPVHGHVEHSGQIRTHGIDERRELWALRDDRHIHVSDFITVLAYERSGATEQVEARRVLPLTVAVGKVPTDIPGAGGTENRIGDRVTDRIGIRVA